MPCHEFHPPFSLLNVLEAIAPFKHFNKLREFVQMRLPPGFPVKIGVKPFLIQWNLFNVKSFTGPEENIYGIGIFAILPLLNHSGSLLIFQSTI